MDKYEQKLKQFIKENNIIAEHLSFEKSCHSVQDAINTTGANPNEFIKNIIQSNKLLHFKNVALEEFKVLNMFMKNVPVELPEYKDILDIEIKNIGIRDADNGSLSTLNSINVVGIDLQPILVGFKVVRLET